MGDPSVLLRVKQMLVRQLRLKKRPEELQDDLLLFGGELELDSIDVLEIVVGLEKEFGLRIGDRATGERVIRTPRTLADYVQSELKTRASAG